MNKNMLHDAAVRASNEVKKAMVLLEENETLHPMAKMAAGVQIAVKFKVDVDRIRNSCNPMDVLDITQIGNDYPIGINTNG